MNLIQFLMTPNEVFINIFDIIFLFIEAYLYCKFFTKLLNITTTKTQNLSYIFCTSFIALLIKYIIPSGIVSLINMFTFALLVYFIYKQSIRNTFLALITTYITIFVSAYLGELLLSLLFKITLSNETLSIPLYHILSLLFLYLFFIISIILVIKRKQISKIIRISLKFTVIINLILGITTIFILSNLFSTYKDLLPFNVKFITMASLVIYFLISMYSLMRTKKLEKTTEDLENEKIYNKTLSHLHDNIRCFKHDFNNIVQALGGYIALDDMDGLKDYYKNLLSDCKQTNNLNVLNPETINNPSIYSLLTNKYYLAQEKGINMTFTIFTDLSNINFNMYEFSRILGILLDNAIEAAQETDEKIINIEFRSDAKKQLFIIANSCKDTDISTTKIFEKGFSTKANNSGIGLWKVHKILSKNTDADLFTTVNNNMFTQQLEIFYKT